MKKVFETISKSLGVLSFVMVMALIVVFMLAVSSEAGNKKPPVPIPIPVSPSESAADAQSDSNSASDSKSSSTSNAAPSTSSASLSSAYDVHERVRFKPLQTNRVTIGDVSKPVPQVYVQGQTDDTSSDNGHAIQVGVTIPITWGTGTNSALKTESRRLRDRALHARERHQADMALTCMEIHKIIKQTGVSISDELWQRCASYEHFNNSSTMKIMGPHNAHGDPDQFSPHYEEYQD